LAKCDVCGKTVELPYRCHYCGGIFCIDHRLPENHNCPYRPREPPPWIKEALDKMVEQRYQTEEKEQYVTHPHAKFYIEPEKVMRPENKGRTKKIPLLSLPFIVLFAYVICPPIITVDSPKSMVYMTKTIPLSYRRVLPQLLNIYDLSYVIDSQPEKPLSNKNLVLPCGNHTLRVYASIDLFGRKRLMIAEVKFTISKVFNSINELIAFLKRDDLNYREWTPDYTCHNFTIDFIKRAKEKGYYCFVYLALCDDELERYIRAVESIRVINIYPWGTETRGYEFPYVGDTGHAVVKTTVNGMDVIIDPQIDVILSYPDFKVLYEGEIAQEG